MIKVLFFVLLLCSLSQAEVFEVNSRFAKSLNLGNWLEAPNEDWGVICDSTDFVRIASAGFTSVRVPIRWEPRTDTVAPYSINPAFFVKIDNVIRWSLQNGLSLSIDMHHAEALYEDPVGQKARFLSMWGQISRRYQSESDSLLFEIMNEPHGNLDATLWNEFLAEALDTIRVTNPNRVVIIGSAEWGGIGGMSKLVLPVDPNMIFTVHYYEPFSFTHQGASWVDPIPPTGVTWDGTYLEVLQIKNEMDYVKNWAAERGLPVFVGEFGAYSQGDMGSRARWTAACARSFEQSGFSWSYWEYKSGYGVWDQPSASWNQQLLDALMSADTSILNLDPTELGQNLLLNGDFSGNMTSWTFGAWGGTATGSVTSGVFSANITDPGSNSWDIQLMQNLPVLENGLKYALLFDAWADAARGMTAAVQNRTDYTAYGSGSMGLSTTPSTFVLSFNMSQQDNNAALALSMGSDSVTLYIDNVRLVVTGGEIVSTLKAFQTLPGLRLEVVEGSLQIFTDHSTRALLRLNDLNGKQLLAQVLELRAGFQQIALPAGNIVASLELQDGRMLRTLTSERR